MPQPAEPAEDLLAPGQPDEQEAAEIEAAWAREILRRVREHDEGRAQSVPWEQARAELFGRRG